MFHELATAYSMLLLTPALLGQGWAGQAAGPVESYAIK
jgi:hypothetical protein